MYCSNLNKINDKENKINSYHMTMNNINSNTELVTEYSYLQNSCNDNLVNINLFEIKDNLQNNLLPIKQSNIDVKINEFINQYEVSEYSHPFQNGKRSGVIFVDIFIPSYEINMSPFLRRKILSVIGSSTNETNISKDIYPQMPILNSPQDIRFYHNKIYQINNYELLNTYNFDPFKNNCKINTSPKYLNKKKSNSSPNLKGTSSVDKLQNLTQSEKTSPLYKKCLYSEYTSMDNYQIYDHLKNSVSQEKWKKQDITRENQNYNSKIYSFITVKGKTSGIWSLPKGRMSNDTETEEECALREVYEETGIKLQSVENLPRIVIGRNVYFIYHTSKKEFNTFEIHDKEEVSTVAWNTTEELRNMTCNKDLRAILRYPTHIHNYHQLIFK
jgi:ADP-ribose pyrophosphatase YjhB (NUDIX family)